MKLPTKNITMGTARITAIAALIATMFVGSAVGQPGRTSRETKRVAGGQLSPRKIGHATQLFVDGTLICRRDGVEHKAQPASASKRILFARGGMIDRSHQLAPAHVLSAYQASGRYPIMSRSHSECREAPLLNLYRASV